MPILVHSRIGETREAAIKRAKENNMGRSAIFEGDEFRAGGDPAYPKEVGEVLEEYNDDKMKVLKAIGMMRMPWGDKIRQAIENCSIADKVHKSMASEGGLMRFFNPVRLMSVAENKLGSYFSIDEQKVWKLEKYYNIVSNLENGEWHRGATAGITYYDEVTFGDCEAATNVLIDKSNFGEVKRLGYSAGESIAQDMAEADKLAKAMKFPKLREGLTPNQRRAVGNVLKMANNGQNHLTRMVRGVLLALGAEMSKDKFIRLKNDKNKFTWLDYTPTTVEEVFGDTKGNAIWCNLPSRRNYASIIAHFTQEWSCDNLPDRIEKIKIPSDSKFTYVISLGAGELHDVNASSETIRGALNAYAQSMACEDILDQAYCIGSMLLLHDSWPAVHLPATLWASDLIRPAMATKHDISRHKREWSLRESMVLAKYAIDCIGLMVKEIMSSGWDHTSEKASDVIDRVSRGHISKRTEVYRWMIENICGEDSGFIFNLDPLKNAVNSRINKINETSCLRYWWCNEVKSVGGDSICSALLCSNYTTIPSSGKDSATAREIGFLRQIGVVKNGPMYKREVRLRNVEVDNDGKKVIDSCIKEGRVSVLPGGVSLVKNRRRTVVDFDEWSADSEEVDTVAFDDDDEVEWDDDVEKEDEEVSDEEEMEAEVEVEEVVEEEVVQEEEVVEEQVTPEKVVEEKEEEKKTEVEEEPEKIIKPGTRWADVESDDVEDEILERKYSQRKLEFEKPARGRAKARGRGGRVRIVSPATMAKKRGEKVEVLIEAIERNKQSEKEGTGLASVSSAPRVRRGEKSDKELLSAIYESNQEARKSKFWQGLKDSWVRESEFLLTNWRNRKISESAIEKCCNLMGEIFPVTSLHIGGESGFRSDMVRLAGTFFGYIETCPKEQGEWDKNHFLIQCWGWEHSGVWISPKIAQKISDVCKEMNEIKRRMDFRDKLRWDDWCQREFGAPIENIGTWTRAGFDQSVREGGEKINVEKICKMLELEEPKWGMKDKSKFDLEEIVRVMCFKKR